MSTWNYIVIVLSFLLLVFTSWKEWKRSNRSRMVLRLFASFFAVISFACLALPITRTVKVSGIQEKQVVLLTDGFNKDSVNRFLKENKNVPVYVLDIHLTTNYKNYNVKFLSIDDLVALKKQLPTIHVYGYGLEEDELQILAGTSIVFHPDRVMNGITSINWQHKIKTGERLRVQGNFVNSSSSEIKLIFSGYGVNLDTVLIPATKNASFELSAVPKQLGKAVYALTALAGKDTVEKDPLPFEIEQPDNIRVLILAASPDFENKFLKNWLSQNNYPLITRTTISKNKYEKTFLNTARVPFNSITNSFLQDFDLVIADVSELATINRSELAAIESQVAQKGIGLIVRADSASARNAFYSRPFPLLENSDKKQKDLSIYIPVSNQYVPALTTEQPVYIRPKPGAKSLIEDKQSNIMVSSSIHGAGRLIYSTLNNTFAWMLSGDKKTYQTFWSYLFDEATAKTDVDKSWSITPAFPFANKAVEINFASNNSETPQVQVGEDFVRFIQNPDLPFQWQGSYWPHRSGWQPIMMENKNTFWWYAYGSDDWKMVEASKKIKTTLQNITANLNSQSQDKNGIPIEVPVSKKYFFVLFLVCAGFLWVEKKL